MVGVVVSETTSDTAIAILSVIANSRNKSLVDDAAHHENRDKDRATRVVLIESTVNPIAVAPRNAGGTGVIPCSRQLEHVFQQQRMASSTTKPVEIASAMSDRLSSVYPRRYMTPNVPISDSGTAMLGMMVARTVRRKTNTTRMTRANMKLGGGISISCRRRGP